MFKNLEIKPIIIVLRESWSWAFGYRVFWKIIDTEMMIHEIESKCQMKIIDDNLDNWTMTLDVTQLNLSKFIHFDKINEKIINNIKSNVKYYSYTNLGSANSAIYIMKENKIILLERHNSEYYTHDENTVELVNEIYKLVEYPSQF